MAVQINVAASQAALVNSIQAGVNAYNQRFANQNQINLSINAKAFSQPLGRITGDVKDFEAALAASNARVIAFGASTAVLGAAIRSFKELASTTIEVEKNLADINRVLGLTTGGLQKFSTDLFDVAKQTASSFNDVSKAALEFSRQGLKVEDTLQRTKDALTLARLAGMSTSAAVDSLTSSVNGFASTGITTTQVLNKLVAVEQNYAVGAGDLAEALSRTGQAAQEAGVSIDQLNALVTSAQEKTARGGAVIGNALKTIFTRLQRSETLDQLEAYNIAVRDVQGNTLPAVSILQNFAAAYKNLADSQKAQLSEQVAGVYQVNILKAIVGDLNSQQSTYSKALKDGANATNEADVATAKLNQTLSALFSQTATGTQQLANNIGKVTFEPLAREAVNTANSVIQVFNQMLEGEGIGSDFANGFLKGIRNLLGGPGALAAFYTLFKLVQNSFTYLTSALPQIAGITTETQNRKNIEQVILGIMQQQGPLSQALAGHMGDEVAQAQLLLNAATARTAKMQQELALAQKLAATLSSQGVTQKGGSGLIVKSSGGYIPPATRMAETLGAKAGGYTPGRVVGSPVGGVMNTAENVKYIPGFAQPFINPPANSKAGMAHRRNAIARTGVDPYMFGGFIPNFANKAVAEITQIKDGDTISALPIDPKSVDFRLAGVDAAESNQKFGLEATRLLANKYINADILNNHIPSKGNAAYFRSVFEDTDIAKQLVLQGLGVPDLRYTRDPDLLSIAKKYSEPKKEGEGNPPGLWSDPIHPKLMQYRHQIRQLGDPQNVKYIDTKRAGTAIIKDKDLLEKLRYEPAYDDYSFNGFIPNFAKKSFVNPIWIHPLAGIFQDSEAADHNDLRQIFKGKIPSDSLRGYVQGSTVSVDAPLNFLYRKDDEKTRSLKIKQLNDIVKRKFGSSAKLQSQGDADPLYKALGLQVDDFSKESSWKIIENLNSTDFLAFMEGATHIRGRDSELDAGLEEILKEKALQQKKLMTLYGQGFGRHFGFIPNFAEMSNSKIAAALRMGRITPEQAAEMGYKPSAQKIAERKGLDYVQTIPYHVIPIAYKTFNESGAALASGYGTEYENYAISALKGMGYSGVQSARQYGIPGGGNSRVDAIDPVSKAFFEMKGGHITSMAELKAKFAGVRQDLVKKYSDELLTYRDILVRNPNWEKSSAGGFIPNFAYKQAVMSLETGLSGKAAVFDTKPFPHIRNSGQPSFASAIADHGGLKNALADSFNNQRAFGLMNKGFVPNFAQNPWTTASTFQSVQSGASNPAAAAWMSAANSLNNFTTTVNNASNATQNNANVTKNSSGRLEKFSNTILFAGPIIAGLAEQFIFGNKKRTEMSATERAIQSGLSTGVTSITTGVSIGNAILPGWGAAIGAGVGALTGLTSALNATKLSAEELTQIAQEEKDKSLQNISAGEKYIRAQQEYAELLANGVSQSKLDIASKNIANAFKEISDIKLADELSKTKGGVEALNSVLDKYQTDKNVLSSALSFAAGMQKGTVGSVALGARVQELKGVNLTEEQIKNLRSFQQRRESKGYLARFGLGIAEEFGKNVDYGQITEQTKNEAEALSYQIARQTIGNKGTVEQLQQFQTALFNILTGKPEDREKLLSQLISNESNVKQIVDNAKEIANLYNLRNKLELENINYVAETNRALKANDFGRKLQTELFNFQAEMSASLIDPLDQIAEKFNFNSKKITSESEDAIKKLNTQFLEKNLTDLLKGTQSSEIIQSTISRIMQDIKGGDFSSFQGLIGTETFAATSGETTLLDPAVTKKLKEAYEAHQQNILEEKNNLDFNLQSLIQSANIENIKAANLKLLQNITNQEIINAGMRERAEIERKNNLSLEMDLLERRMSNEGRYLGLGMMGKAEEKNRIRNEILTKKLVDLEITKSSSAQKDYTDILNTTKQNFLTAAAGQTVGSPLYAEYMTKAEAIKPLDIKNANDLRDAIKEISNIRFEDSKEEEKRIATLEKLKTVEKEIETGKINELELTKRLNEEELLRAERATSFRYGLAVGFDKLRDQADTLGRRLGEEIPTAFADGMTNALMEVAKGTKSIGDAFKDMAINFGQMLMQEVMRAAIGKALYSAFPSLTTVGGALAGSQKGGLIRAQNGMYISGGRTGDRNLALLEDGEYVLNRNAVKAFGGPSALDQFNYRNAPRFGGGFQSGGGFDMAAQMQLKNNEVGYTDNLLFGNTVFGKINASDYSAYAYENDQYFKTQRDEALRKEQERVQKAFAKKQKNAQLISSIVGMAGAIAGMKAMSPKGPTGINTTALGTKIDAGKLDQVFASMNTAQTGGLIGFNSGGFVPYGSRLNDTIPALLTGGEYVMNNSAVQRYGLGTLNSMNAGSYNNSTSATTNNNTHNNATNISINVDSNGKAVYGADTSSYEKQDIVMSKKMASSINQIVMATLSNEKRYGGELYKNPLRS